MLCFRGFELYSRWVPCASDFNLTQMVTEPTQQGNILDLLFSSHPDLVDQ